MKISLNTIKRYTSVTLSTDELVKKINSQLGGVESIVDLNVRYKDALIVRVVSCDGHPDADRLHVCRIDDAGQRQEVERDADGFIQVVCGAPNVHADMLAVWLPPGSFVPSSFSDAEPFKLDARKLRGVMSYGMLASPQELGLGDSHEGLLELNAEEPLPEDGSLVPGAHFGTVFGLDDTIIDIENKMFTHRPDCFGQLGVAREIAGVQNQPFTSPSWYLKEPTFPLQGSSSLSVTNDAGDKVPRFMAVAIKGVAVEPSPIWLQAELVRLGAKPINNVVDVTNYLMLLTGQPLHAYDYATLRGGTIGARFAAEGETVSLLNGKTYDLDTADIVIADEKGPIGLGGVMGGRATEVSPSTTDIVLESATFDMYSIRKTSMRHGLFTDAVTRFTKGQSPLQNDRVLSLAIRTIIDAAGGEVSSHIYDLVEKLPPLSPVVITADFINKRLGLDLTADAVKHILENVEFDVVEDGSTLNVAAPFWRTDIAIAEDVVEEVGRLYGFDKLPRELPSRTIRPAALNKRLELNRACRQSLLRSGANEALTYSFVHHNIITRAVQNVDDAYQLSNALSPDLQYYRLSVLPSLFDKIHANIKTGHDEFALFEIGKGHSKSFGVDTEGLPVEKEQLAMVYARKTAREGAAFYSMKRLVCQLAKDLHSTKLAFVPLDDSAVSPELAAPFEPSRSAEVQTAEGITLGVVGELKKSVRTQFKLPDYTAAATVNLDVLLNDISRTGSSYVPLSRFPKVSQDISLKVPVETPYASLHGIVDEVLGSSEVAQAGQTVLQCLSIYSPEGGADKTITFHVEISSYERTLTEGDVSGVLDAIESRAASELAATRV